MDNFFFAYRLLIIPFIFALKILGLLLMSIGDSVLILAYTLWFDKYQTNYLFDHLVSGWKDVFEN